METWEEEEENGVRLEAGVWGGVLRPPSDIMGLIQCLLKDSFN